MRKKALAAVVVLLVMMAPAVAGWSWKDLLKGTASHALELFKREVMPIDGYKKLKVGEGFWIRGEHFWNPDYYVHVESAKVYWSYLAPTDVDVKVTVYKVYFGIFAFKYAEYEDIWWKKKEVGDGWIGAFFVWGFSWSPGHGWRNASTAYIAYNLPSAQDLNVKNVTILENGTVRLLFNDDSTKILSFGDFEGFGRIATENVTFKHLFGNLYIVRRG